MRRMPSRRELVRGALALLVIGSAGAAAPGVQAPRQERRVFRDRVEAHWLAGGSRFWYLNDLRGGAKEFVLVDAELGSRALAFDHDRLAAALSAAAGAEYAGDRLPFREPVFADDARSLRFRVGDAAWECDLETYGCTPTDAAGLPAEESDDAALGRGQGWRRGRRSTEEQAPSPLLSPDGKWSAFVTDHDVHVQPAGEPAEPIRLSEDGTESLPYGLLSWSPDSQALVAFRIEPGERKEVHLIESSPREGGRAQLHSRPYALPGDRFPRYEPNVFLVAERRPIRPEVDRFESEWSRPRLRWSLDGKRFAYTQTDRGHQRFRVIEIDARTGAVRNLVDERSETFIWTAHTEGVGLDLVTWMTNTDELILASERSGWRHLYRIDAETGELANAITAGEWVVRGIDHVDESRREVWFRASGVFPGQDPYFVHCGRVGFDGSGLVWLTEADGDHRARYSPDRRFLIDTWSRVDAPPVTELRRCSDGTLVRRLEEADVSDLLESGWRVPQVFVAKGRDGTTDIWGIVCRPRDFEPGRKYPVIEDIYAGPQGAFVPKSFSAYPRYESLTDLGFIVVKIDGMGTAHRSKAFHDVCWKNLKDAGLPDRILWMKAAAAEHPELDLARVGVFGNSAGGQNAAAAVLFHPDFYKVAVASCGCHDNRMDKASWNEQWMGHPVGPQYSECSNIDNANRLQGKLLLIVGEMDNNVPPESTLRFADALIRAGKDFDLVVIPGGGHGMGAYGDRRTRDFFVRHLLGVEPPDRNAAAAPAAGPAVTEPPESFFALVREEDREAARAFYSKHVDVDGIPVAASREVDDLALLRTHEVVTRMLAGRPDVAEALVKSGMYLIVIGRDQVYTDMPEYRNHPDPAYQNERVRGTGGRPTSFGEENLLSLPLDRYDDESIAVHEFCHTIDGALRSIDPAWRERRDAVFRASIGKGLWKDTYAASNPGEFWAEIAQSYFDCNRVNNWNHGPVGTREQLAAYDPDAFELARTTFGLEPEQDWRYEPLRKLPNVAPPPGKLGIDPWYTKFTWARELTVIGRGASDEALLRANDVVRRMFAYRHDVLKALIADGQRLVVLGRNESIEDLPENVPESKLLVVDEAGVLADPGDPLAGDCPVIRVFATALHRVCANRPVDPDWDHRGRAVQQYELRVQRLDVRFDQDLAQRFESATGAGLWNGTPASRDRVAYWTAGVLAYFDAAGRGAPPHGAPRPIATREALAEYDPALFALVHETFAYAGKADWRRRPSVE